MSAYSIIHIYSILHGIKGCCDYLHFSTTVSCDRLSDPADASLSPVGLANEDANDWIVLYTLLIQQASNQY